jgi:ribosomal protein S21
MSKFNFQVKANPKNRDASSENQKLLKRFIRKWKNSGMLREIKEREYAKTKVKNADKKELQLSEGQLNA